MHKRFLFILFFLGLLSWSCSNSGSEEGPNQTADTEFFEFGEFEYFLNSIVVDKSNDLAYLTGFEVGGRIVAFNYNTFEVASEVNKGTRFGAEHYKLAQVKGDEHLMLAYNGEVKLYRTPDLGLKFSVSLLEQTSSSVFSLSVENDNRMLVGCCDYSSDGVDVEVYSLNLDDNNVMDSHNVAEWGCARMNTFPKDVSAGIYGVYGSINNKLLYGEFNVNSGEISLNERELERAEAAEKDFKSNPNINYFLRSGRNSDIYIYDKQTAALISRIDGSYSDYDISDSGDKIYAFDGFRGVDVYDYPSLRLSDNISLPARGRGVLSSGAFGRIFVDDNNLIVIYNRDDVIFFSKIDLAE